MSRSPGLDLGQMLENLGHEVVGQAGDGKTAVDLARAQARRGHHGHQDAHDRGRDRRDRRSLLLAEEKVAPGPADDGLQRS